MSFCHILTLPHSNLPPPPYRYKKLKKVKMWGTEVKVEGEVKSEGGTKRKVEEEVGEEGGGGKKMRTE